MKMLVVLVALTIMIRLSGQGTENSLFNPASPDKTLVIFTYYRQFLPDLESVTYLSNDQVLYATFFNSLDSGAFRNLKSQVKSDAELLFRIVFRKRTIRDMDEKEIVIPVKLSDGRSIYLFPEHRLIIDYTGRAHMFSRIKPILITESRLSVWLRITV
ncbi:MAG: hypothetical protein AB9888_01400 [Bacteroidales bacterium]